MEIRPLRDSDDRLRFQSGDADLDRFFHLFAGQNLFRHHVGVTYIAIEKGRILGFATIAAGHIEIDDLPIAAKRKLPGYPLPILRLARLAVDATAQGQGVGAQLLRFVLKLALRMASDFGCIGLSVDAKRNAITFYERYGFIAVDAVEGQSDARPQPVTMFLSLREVEDLLDER
jgi:GNAT superfamily N-acetyltransferase